MRLRVAPIVDCPVNDADWSRIKQRIGEIIRRRYSLSWEELIGELTPVKMGYYCGADKRKTGPGIDP